MTSCSWIPSRSGSSCRCAVDERAPPGHHDDSDHDPTVTDDGHVLVTDGTAMAGDVYRDEPAPPDGDHGPRPSDTHAVFDFAPGYRAARELAELGFGVLTVDRVGYGASSPPERGQRSIRDPGAASCTR